MSRSRRKTPIFGHTTATSDARWKKAAARKLRRAVKQRLEGTLDGDCFAGKALGFGRSVDIGEGW